MSAMEHRHVVTYSAALGLFAALSLAAQDPSGVIPAGGSDLLPLENGFAARPVVPKEQGFATAEKLHSTEAPWADYWRFNITKQPENTWSVQLGATIKGGIAKGDKCLL